VTALGAAPQVGAQVTNTLTKTAFVDGAPATSVSPGDIITYVIELDGLSNEIRDTMGGNQVYAGALVNPLQWGPPPTAPSGQLTNAVIARLAPSPFPVADNGSFAGVNGSNSLYFERGTAGDGADRTISVTTLDLTRNTCGPTTDVEAWDELSLSVTPSSSAELIVYDPAGNVLFTQTYSNGGAAISASVNLEANGVTYAAFPEIRVDVNVFGPDPAVAFNTTLEIDYITNDGSVPQHCFDAEVIDCATPITNFAKITVAPGANNGRIPAGALFDVESNLVEIPCVLLADLAVSKTTTATEAAPGEAVPFEIVVENIGPSTATSVTLTDVIPAGATASNVVVTGGDGSGSCTSNLVCNLGDLAVNETVTVSLLLTTSTEGLLTNTATVEASETDPDLTNNSADASVSVAVPPPPTTIPPTTVAPTTVAPTMVAPTPPPTMVAPTPPPPVTELPATGASTRLGLIASLTVAAGLAAVLASRRRFAVR